MRRRGIYDHSFSRASRWNCAKGDVPADLNQIPLSAPRFKQYRNAQTIFTEFAAENFSAFTLTGLGDPVQVFGGRLTWNYFDLLRVRPIRGRNFLPEEEDRADVAVVTERFWQGRLGGDPSVIGRSITLDGTPQTIVGVVPNQPAAWFGANAVAEVWTAKPFVLPGFSYERMMRGTGFLRVLGRLKPGGGRRRERAWQLVESGSMNMAKLDELLENHGIKVKNPDAD